MSGSTLKQFIDGSWVPVIAGSPGPGIATGGIAGQVLLKSGPAEYATEWADFNAVVNDLTPQLGGDLDLNLSNITGTGNINISGSLTASSIAYPVSDGTNGQVLTTNGLGVLSFADASGGIVSIVEDLTPQLGGDLDLNSRIITQASSLVSLRILGNLMFIGDGSNSIALGNGALSLGGINVVLGTTSLSQNLTLNGIKFPVASTGGPGQVLTLTNATTLAFSTPAVVNDLTPQLGGELDGQGNIVSNITLKGYKETIHSLGTTDTPAIDVANGNIQTVTITAGLALPLFTNPAAGQSVTLTVSGSGTATGAAGYIFAGGAVTLTTNSIVTIFYDGTNYWTNISTDFQ